MKHTVSTVMKFLQYLFFSRLKWLSTVGETSRRLRENRSAPSCDRIMSQRVEGQGALFWRSGLTSVLLALCGTQRSVKVKINSIWFGEQTVTVRNHRNNLYLWRQTKQDRQLLMKESSHDPLLDSEMTRAQKNKHLNYYVLVGGLQVFPAVLICSTYFMWQEGK